MSRYTRSPSALTRRTMLGLVVRERGGPTVMIGGSGWLIWERLATPVELGDLVDRVATDVGESPEYVRDDVEATVRRLVEQRLVRAT